MTRSRTRYVCSNCQNSESRWFGRCPACGEFNTVEEHSPVAVRASGGRSSSAGAAASFAPLTDVDPAAHRRVASGIPELDRVLGGGIVPGSYMLIGAEPGAGKSTLASQLLIKLAGEGRRVAVVCAEESPAQVKLRFSRLGSGGEGIQITSETVVEQIVEALDAGGLDLLVVDSIQTVQSVGSSGTPGSVSQVRECGQLLMRLAKERGISVLLIGQVTKDGSLAGPRNLEHLVDVVLSIEGDRQGQFRLLRAHKNRFGSTDEIGVFTMTSEGLIGVPDPSAAFVTERPGPAPGAVLCPVIEGTRPIMVEVQALVNVSNMPQPIRACRGIDSRRFQLLLAVLSRRCNLRLGTCDVFLQIAGGINVDDPALDLACCMAIASAYRDNPLPAGAVACGEVSLLGEIRAPSQAERRAAEAARIGYATTIGAPRHASLRQAIDLIAVTEREQEPEEALA